MLDLKLLQKQPELVERALSARQSEISVAEFKVLDERRRALISEAEALKGERNRASSRVAEIKKAGGDATALMQNAGELGRRIAELDEETQTVKAALNEWMLRLPNIPHSSVPLGKNENDNVEVKKWGNIPSFDFSPKEHWEIGAGLKGLDFERAGRLAGSRFCVSWRWAARLERALANFFLDVHTREQGYTEVLPPQLVNRRTMTGTGQLPKFEEDLFKLEGLDYYLIPTAEVPLTNLHAQEILEESSLPLAYTAQTACFRSEAGSYGKDTRGLVRQHQFTKVEMVRFAHPDESYAELELLLAHAEELLQRLELPYRVITLCTGDLGFGAAKTYDLEVWLPGQNRYREISSCSNCGDFQARRADIRFRPAGGGRAEFVHTLNGSGLPTGRTLVAILENNQRKEGSFIIPKVLRPYMDGVEAIERVDI
jgi:seryl-tRNA synthetase